MATAEQKTHLAIVEWLRKQHPMVAEHIVKIDNEGKRSVGGHILAIRMGLHKGASDLFIAWPTLKYYGLWLEIKPDQWKGPQGKKAKLHHAEQAAFIEKMKARGYHGDFAIGVDEGMQKIQGYLKGN